ARDRQKPERGQPADRARNPVVADYEPHRTGRPLHERAHSHRLRSVSGILFRLMGERRPTNSELRLRRLTAEEKDPGPRGILEIFADAEPADEDAALARDDDGEADQ